MQETAATRDARGSIPPEVKRFLLSESARSLIVRGKPGTGKTTFCLQCLEEIGLTRSCFYFSTRVSDTALYSQFKWLREKEWRDKILDASRGFLKAMGEDTLPHGQRPQIDPRKAELMMASRELLGAMYDEKTPPPTSVDRTMLNNLLQQGDMLDLARLYDRIERRLPEPSYLIIDSLDGLADKYELTLPKLAFALQKDLVENSGVRVLLVLESEPRTVDYMVDGVVNMDVGEIERRRIREITIEKLRGEQVAQHRYLFTLIGGRFRYLPPFRAPPRYRAEKWVPSPDPEGLFSTGNPQLDHLLGGGVPRGGNVFIELMNNLPEGLHRLLVVPMALNFGAQGRGVMVIPFTESSAEEFHSLGTALVSRDMATRLLRVGEMLNPNRNQDKPYVVTLEFSDIQKDYEKWTREALRLRKITGQPLLEIIAVETQEARFSAETYKKFLNVSAEVAAKEGDVVVRISKPGLDNFTQRVANASGIHLKFKTINGAVIFFSERPHTQIYCVETDESKAHPHMLLVPIV